MRLRFTKSVLMAGLLATSGAALACADVGCDPVWSLFGGAQACYNRAVIAPGNDSRVNLLALLRDSAGLGLGGKAYPAAGYDEESFGHTFLDWGMVSRQWTTAIDPNAAATADAISGPCDWFRAGAADFTAALAANRGLPGADRTALSTAREGMVARCSDQALPAVLPGVSVSSAPGKAFLAYLTASDAFYAARYGEALGGYAALVKVPDPWVAETARYMVGRTELRTALANSIDEYGYFDGLKSVDKAAALRGRAALADYLKTYPKGRYAASAEGLERRAMWLSGDFAALGTQYEALLAEAPKDDEALVNLIEEADNKYLANSDNPNPLGGGLILLAAADLMRMRVADPADGEVYDTHPLDAATLASQQASFLRAPELYAFLQANHAFYVGKDYARVLQLIPDDARRPSYTPLAFSRQVLRGQALAAKGDVNEAGFWLELLGGAKSLWQRPTVELGLAMNWERHGKLAQVFALGSPITDSSVREILIAHSAGPALLRSAAQDAARPQHERDAALFTLLYKQLSRGDYAGFGANLALVRGDAPVDGRTAFDTGEPIALGLFTKGRTTQAGFACPALSATAGALAANPRDTHARLCLGEFWRLNNFDGYSVLDTAPARVALGGAVQQFPGTPTARGAFYAAAIADTRTPPTDRAYALYRAVYCYAPSAYNACGGEEVPKAQRKAWYDTLKREYSRRPMGAEAEVLLVRTRAAAQLAGFGLAVFALAACHKEAAAPLRVNPAAHDQFFLWAGVPPPPAVDRAKVLYILGGEIRRGGAARLIDMRAGVPRVEAASVWLTVRAERLDWDAGTWRAVIAMLASWRAAGNRLEGLQIDFDAATAELGGYRAFLEDVRRRLPPGTRLSITGLLDWSANGDPAALASLAGVVDEVVIQTYQARSTIPGYAQYFRHIDRLPIPHKIALVEGGEWTPPPALARDTRFGGYVVFLLRPLPLAVQAPHQP